MTNNVPTIRLERLTAEQADIFTSRADSGKKKSDIFSRHVQGWIDSGSALWIEFDQSFHNGTGYFNNLAHIKFFENLNVPLGQVILTFSNDRRRIMIIVGRKGNIVIFDRYTEGEGDVFVTNSDDAYRRMLPTGSLSADNIETIIPNIGLNKKMNAYYEGTIYDHESMRRDILIEALGYEKASEVLGYEVKPSLDDE